jgi:hypothetical protein
MFVVYRGSLCEVKRPWPEVDYSPPSSAEVKNEWSYTSTPLLLFWCGQTQLCSAILPVDDILHVASNTYSVPKQTSGIPNVCLELLSDVITAILTLISSASSYVVYVNSLLNREAFLSVDTFSHYCAL